MLPSLRRATRPLLAGALVALAVVSSAAASQPAPAAPGALAPDSVRADLALLRGALAAYHPALDVHGQRGAFEAHVDSLDAALAARRRPVGPREAAAIVARALAVVRDGHTRLNPLNQSGPVQDALWGGRTALPFAFIVAGDGDAERLVVTRDLSGHLPPGTEVLAIDGRPVMQWLDRLQALSPGDGRETDGLRRARLGTSRADLSESGWPLADVLAPLAFPDLPAEVRLAVRRPGAGAEAHVRVRRLTRAERTERLRAAGALEFGDERAWEARMLDGETGYLRLGSFLSYRFSEPADTLLARALAGLRHRGARRLVLDVRGVQGGTLGGERVARFLARRSLPCLRETVEIASDRADPAYFPYLSSMGGGDGWKQPLPSQAVRALGDGRFELLAVPPCDAGPPPGAAWDGQVAVLADAHNESAPFRLLRAVRAHGLGAVVGRPAGGNLAGTSGGVFVRLRLPRTGLAVDLPLFAYRPGDTSGGRSPTSGPLLPDVEVRWTADDVAQGRDPDVEAALRWLGGY